LEIHSDNFEGQTSDSLENEVIAYKDLAYQQWRELAAGSSLTPAQMAFFSTANVEALFRFVRTDPDEVHKFVRCRAMTGIV